MTEQQSEVRVQVVSPDGEHGSVPLAELKAAKADGFQELSLAESIDQAHSEVDRAMAHPAVTVASALAGVGSQATYGASDLAASKLGLGETAQEMRDAHPYATMAGELGGMFLAPGLGAAGKAAGGLGARLAGTGARSVLGRAAQTAVRTAATVAAEMALIGAGEGVSEEALGDPEANAEKLFAAAIRHGIKGAGEGLVWGGALGGLAGAGAGALGKFKAGRVATRAGAGAGALGKFKTRAVEEGPSLAEAYEAGGIAGVAEHESNVYAAKAAGVDGAALRKIAERGEDVEGAVQRIGSNVREAGIGPFTSKAEIAANASKLRQEAIDGLDKSVSKLDTAVHRFDLPSFAAKVETEVVAPLLRSPSTLGTAEQVQKWLVDTKRAWGEAGPSYREAWKERQALDDIGQKAGAAFDKPAARAFRDVRRAMETQFEADAEKAGAQLGEDVLRDYRLNKAKYADWNTIEKITERANAADLGRGPVSLGDRMSGLTGALLSNPLSGGAFGHIVGGIPGAILGAAFNKALRTYGNQVAATAFDRASKLGVLSRAVAVTDTAIADGAAKVAETATRSTPVSRMGREHLVRVAEEVRTASNDPRALQTRIRMAIGHVGAFAPSTATAMAMTASTAIQHLADTAPRPMTNATASLTPFAEKPRYSDADLDAFAARIEAIEDPISVIDDVTRGRIAREKIDTLNVVYPKLFAELQQKVAIAVAGRTKPLGWEAQKTLAVLLGVPTHPTLTAEFGQAMQATKQPSQPAQEQQHAPRALSRVKVDPSTYQTPTEKIAAG